MTKKIDVTPEVIIRRLHFNQGKTPEEIAYMWSFELKYVQQVINTEKFKTMKKTDMSIKKRNKRIMQLRKEGLTQAAIADNVGCSTSTVQRVLGVRPIAKKQSRPTPKKVVKATKPAANTGFVTEYSILWGAFKFVKSSK
jgi:lambda repressor-like predicted transcriptional regulator